MPALSEAANVVNSCFLILEQKGWRIWYDESLDMYGAEKDGWDLLGDSPAGLLGLVAIYEYQDPAKYEQYWWRADGPEDRWENISKTKPEFEPVWRRE